MKSVRRQYYKFNSLKYSTIEFLSKNKGKLVVFAILTVIALLTGIFTAIKISNNGGVLLDDFSMILFANGEAHTANTLLIRFLSSCAVCVLLYLLSFNYYLSVIGYCLLAYRGYLLGLNCAIIIICCGFGGILNSILIIFPCQLIILVLMGLLFCLLLANSIHKKKYGVCKYGKNKMGLFIVILLIILLLCSVETLLLAVLQSKVILVI